MPEYRVVATGERTYELTLKADTKLAAIHIFTSMLVDRGEAISGNIDTISAGLVIPDGVLDE